MEKVTLPNVSDTSLSYTQPIESILSYLESCDYKNNWQNANKLKKIFDYSKICKNYIFFLWNNKKHMRILKGINKPSSTFNFNDNMIFPSRYHISLGECLDPTLQEFMIRFVDLTHAVGQVNSFVSYHWGLSSGESILLRMFTKLYFTLQGNSSYEKNIDTITANNTRKIKKTIMNALHCNRMFDCDSVILLLDEADLSFHPEWQRVFIATLTEFLPRLYQNPYYEGAKSGCRDIQIILTTHSPLLLGDFPAASVIYLKKDEKGFVTIDSNSKLQPFGQNLYTLLKDGFYLQNGTMGELARRKIASVLHDVQAIQSYDDSLQASLIDEISLDEWEKQLDDHLNKTVKYLPEGILRRKLEEEIAICRQIIWKKRNPDAKEREKQRLKEDIARLQQRLFELENGGESSQ